jgi:nitrite reductase/ring-hydroxylating ferredoxin subunit
MGDRFPFGLPNGWYVVAASDELPPGKVVSRLYFDRELALYRTRSGVVSVVDATCPHMGAHLGRVGKVEGETLRCNFHGFTYDGRGQCVKTAYDGPPPARARLRRWQVREQNGLILTWFDAEAREPEWEVPPLPSEGWNRISWKRFEIATHPQETTENSVDFGHFTELHGFIDGSILEPIKTEGPFLSSSYRAWRPYGLPGRKPFYKFPVNYHVKVWGLGYSQVDVEIGLFGINARVFVLPVPIDDEHIHLLLGVMAETKFGPLAPLIRWIARSILCKEVGQDLDIWTHKEFLERPALAKGDGPVSTYRAWARQFYCADQR